MKKQASLKDLRRMCDYYAGSTRNCSECPLADYDCDIKTTNDLDKINDIVVKWCEEHPVQTRADVFFKQYPNAQRLIVTNESERNVPMPVVCPKDMNRNLKAFIDCGCQVNCVSCKKKYWLQEVSE